MYEYTDSGSRSDNLHIETLITQYTMTQSQH